MISYVLILLIFLGLLFERGLAYYKHENYKKETKEELEKVLKLNATLVSKPLGNYENDIKFLNEMIEHQLKMTLIFKLKPMQMAGYKVLENELFKELREDITITIYNSMSESYQRNLESYFSEQGLLEYIVEIVNVNLTETLLSLQIKIS